MRRGLMYLYKKITCSRNTAEEDCRLQKEEEVKFNNLHSSAMEPSGNSTVMASSTDQATSQSVMHSVHEEMVPNTESPQGFVCSESACLCKTINDSETMLIKNKLNIFIDKIYPSSYYDFCIVTCEADYERASVFRSKFCQRFNLKGCMLYDPEMASAGADVFELYEAMIDRSTKVLFFLTKNYKLDKLLLRVQNGAVYQQLEYVQNDREKCIPVFPDGTQNLGLALAGIVGLDLTLPLNFDNCVHATFSEQVRKVRIIKESRDMKMRQELFYKVLHTIIKRSSSSSAMISEHVKTLDLVSLVNSILTSLPVKQNMELLNQFSVLDDFEEKTDTKSSTTTVNISGSSSGIHVGPKVVLNINIGPEYPEE